RNLRTPYVQNYNFNIQHEIFRNGVLEVGYVGSHGTKLFRYRDINQPPVPSVSTARPFDNGPFAPSGGTFFYVNFLETSSNSNYTGDFNGTGEFFARPDVIGDPFAGTNGSNRFLNLAAFKVPCTFDEEGSCIPGTFHFGSLGRNSLPGPHYRNFDMSLFKTTA